MPALAGSRFQDPVCENWSNASIALGSSHRVHHIGRTWEPWFSAFSAGMLGFTVLTAKDGLEAVEVFRQHQAEIRCVLTDLAMPRLDGWGLLSALHQIAPNLPVILASGYDKAQVLAGNDF